MLLSGDFEFGSCCAGKEHGLWGDFVSVGGHQVGKTAKNGLGNAASGISALSLNNTNLAHGHSITSAYGRLWNDYGSPGGSVTRVPSNAGNYINKSNEFYAEGNLGDHAHSLSSGTAAAQTITGDNETRPVNRGVRYIIKV